MHNEPLRPDPDRLLEQTAAPHRGKLKIFFGACAGVGKTWAMLAEAQRLRAQGLDVLIGVVETHGRKETAALLDGLSILPLKRQARHGRHISEFDLDAALARRPALILMDELAHSNAPGSRHPKRWQDIEETFLLPSTCSIWKASMMWSAASQAFRFAKPSPILFSMPPTMWCWSIFPPTICANA